VKGLDSVVTVVGTTVAAVAVATGTGKGRATRAGDDEEYPVPCTTAVTGVVRAAVAAAAIGATGRLTGSGRRELHGMVIPEGNVVVVAVTP
jgi:hypothetical protein